MSERSTVRRVGILSLHSSPLAPLGSADAGGMNYYVSRLSDELSARGLAVDVFTRRTSTDVPLVVHRDSGVRVVHIEAGPVAPIRKDMLPLYVPDMLSSLRAWEADQPEPYDVWHSHYWISGVTALRLRGNSEAPVVHMFHTMARVKEHYFDGALMESDFRLHGERCVIGGADVIIGATSLEYDQFHSLYERTPAAFKIIPPGVDLDVFSPHDRLESRKRLGIEAERVILFVGRPDRIKGLGILLSTFSRLPEGLRQGTRLIVVGDAASWASSDGRDVQERVQVLGLSEHVDLRGSVPQNELSAYYAAADITAMPSAYESFGMVASESMACSTPVVGFDVGGLATIIRDGQTGYLARTGDLDAFARTLERALLDPERDAVGRRARLSVQRYSWNRTAADTLATYVEARESRLDRVARAAGQD